MPTRFLTTPENQAALAALQGCLHALIEERPADPPLLYLHGPSGSGKSTLASIVGAELAGGEIRLCVLSANAFADGQERRDARAADLLILEDLQHLPTRGADLLIGLLDERGRGGAATVLTALHGPSQVRHRGVAFPPRLVDRLASGLVVAVEPMGERTRLRFLQVLAEENRLSVTAEVLGWLAEQLPGGGRQLEGAVRQLQMLQRTQKKPLQLKDVRPHFVSQGPGVQRITEAVSGYYRVAPKKLQSPRRSREVVLARQVSMYLARRLCQLPLQKIGAYFGGRDHKTVLHACGKVESALESDARLRGAIRHLTTQLA